MTGPAKRPTPASMRKAVARWNAANPVGTAVRYWPGLREGDGRTSVTTSEATIFGGHTVGVYVERAGFVALTHVEALPAPLRVFTFLDCCTGRVVAVISSNADAATCSIIAYRASEGIAVVPSELGLLGSVVAVEGAVVVDSSVEDLASVYSLPMPEDGGAA